MYKIMSSTYLFVIRPSYRKPIQLSKCSETIKRSLSIESTMFAEDYKQLHIPTTGFQKVMLSVGASVMSLLNPARGGE